MRGLVSMNFLAAMNIYFGGNRALPKNVMNNFFLQSFYASIEHI